MVDKKEARFLRLRIFYSKMTEEIALKSFRMHAEAANITGMMYFNIMSGEAMQEEIQLQPVGAISKDSHSSRCVLKYTPHFTQMNPARCTPLIPHQQICHT
ncbi:hypothetical protein AAMO2058_001467100 [Amorphochlora amoebiformis]